ncbi:cytochrome P450 [Catellatospora sp. TT07R-123]|uniref:cytochrome P450 family protein n=1 Tax=Catellatospora sp. TT07R-123 TaxID=2733863 RepID=UPI001B2696C2|nr:cytochrome P450 [Catellatospora sp. TT07R-123]GHJ44216.1 cytochrome P450 [Catellatospora sp. TT07R-123]
MSSGTPVAIDPLGRDIHGEAQRLREQGPVTRIELPGGVLAWSVTGYDVARRVLADERFSKDPRKHWTAYAEGRIDPDFPLIVWARMENLTTAHGDDHSRQRRLIAKAFSPQRIAAMRPKIEKLVAELLAELSDLPPGTVVDLKAQYAHPVAARVIGELIGVPEADRDTVLGAGYAGTSAAVTPENAAAVFAQRFAAIQGIIEAKRREPAEDLASDLIAARDEDDSRLSAAELVSTLLLLLNTGTEPAMNLIVNAAHALLTHESQRDLVLAGEAGWSGVIEETLRVEAPVAHLPFRYAVEDVDLDGVVIAKGDPVLVHFAAVGRDPEVHGESACRFDTTRQSKQHLSFGHGMYRCLGSSLAWLEVEIALATLFARFPRLALAVPPEKLAPQGTFIMNGLHTLPVLLHGVADAQS